MLLYFAHRINNGLFLAISNLPLGKISNGQFYRDIYIRNEETAGLMTEYPFERRASIAECLPFQCETRQSEIGRLGGRTDG